jgi:hypothetical protein
MNELSTWLALVIAAIGVFGAFIGWLLKHGSRLASAEIMIGVNSKAIDQNSTRADGQFGQISAALVRIEDKIDKKMDRH